MHIYVLIQNYVSNIDVRRIDATLAPFLQQGQILNPLGNVPINASIDAVGGSLTLAARSLHRLCL